jgi:hypothetical protein
MTGLECLSFPQSDRRLRTIGDGGTIVYKPNEPFSNHTALVSIVVDTLQVTSDPARQDKTIILIIMDGLKDIIREVLSGRTFRLDELDDDTGIFDHVDAFVNLSRGNDLVEEVVLRPFTDPDEDASSGTDRYAIWNKIAEGIGNLQELRKITIMNFRIDDEEALDHDWEILACILRRLRRGIQLCLQDDVLLGNTEALPAFAGAIHGQAMITGFITPDDLTLYQLNNLCSTLLTLPALENLLFHFIDEEEGHNDDEEEAQSLESMVKLLQSPSLREIHFESFVFTNNLFQVVAKVLKERSEITDLRFYHCSFPKGGDVVIASLLKTNTTLKSLTFFVRADEVFYGDLAAALLFNSTLQKLAFTTLGSSDICSWLSPLFLALQVNRGLKELKIDQFDLIDEELSAAMKIGLGKNSTLELVYLSAITCNDDTCLWREALSFLRTNKALETLHMHFEENVTESHANAIRMEVPAALSDNESLETISMPCQVARFEDYVVFVTALERNTTLKRLLLYPFNCVDYTYRADQDETKELIPVLKKNYGLEAIPGLHHGAGDISSIFELNRAGRRYLVQDGSSISKGVDVLCGVSNDINSVFFHLLENPRLCDRSAVELSSVGNVDDGMVPSPGNHSGGKREQPAPSHAGKETHRRLE